MIAAHVRRLWPRYPWLPAAPFWAWTLFCAARSEMRWDHVALALFVTLLAYGTSASKRLFVGLLPMGLVALLYDSMRLFKNLGLTADRIHICDLRAAEARWFGLTMNGEPATVHDWLQQHWSVPIDVFCAVAYGTFLYVVLLYALFLLVREFPAGRRFMWGFFALNVAGFATYHVYPAAPPWYYHAHGCVADLAAKASAGPNLTRVDQWLGVAYFSGFYSRSNDVFGAVPSLHVAYPLLMVFEGWHQHRALGRALLVAFYAWMCFSAVYLDHHWVIDVLLGSAYAATVALALRAGERLRTRKRTSDVARQTMRARFGS